MAHMLEKREEAASCSLKGKKRRRKMVSMSSSNSSSWEEDSRFVDECKKRKVEQKHPMMMMLMDRCKNIQCWTMLKQLMVGRDAWIFKNDILDPKILYVLDKYEASRKPKDLEDVELKLKDSDYSEADEFVDDVRLVLSYTLQYPPRSEVHRTASRISERFEVSWESMKERWMREERDQRTKKKKICSRRNHVDDQEL